MLEIFYKCSWSIPVLSQIKNLLGKFTVGFFFLITDGSSNSSAIIPVCKKEYFILTAN